MSPPHHIAYSLLLPTTGEHVVKALRIILYYWSTCPHLAIYLIFYYYLLQVNRSTRRQTLRSIPIPQVTMSPPRHISYSLLLHTTGLQVNTSSKPSEAYHYYRSPCNHLAIYLNLFYHLLQVYRLPCRQNLQKHTSTTGHHVTTSPYVSLSTNTYYRSTGQHVVKTLRNIPVLQVTMSPPRHLSHSLLLHTTGLHVNMSSKPSEAYHYYRSPCRHLAIYLILYYYLLQVHRSTCRQSPQKHTITTGHHVTTSPYVLISSTTYYRSTGRHVVKTLRSIPVLQVTMSPPHHVSYSLLLPTTGLHVNMSSKPSEAYHYYRSPCRHLAIYLILYYYLLQVNTSSKPPESYHYYRSPCPHLSISHSLLLPTTGQHVVKALRIILYYWSTCPHLAIYLILYYYLLQVYRSTRRQNPQNQSFTTDHHVTGRGP